MAAVYSNALGLFNLTTKSTPIGADLVPLGDSAVTGVPLKQATISSILAIAEQGLVTNVTASTQAMVINTTYYVNYAGGVCTLTLPTAGSSGSQGVWVQIRGGESNTAGYVIALNTNQTIRFFGSSTTTSSGSLTMPGNFGSIRIECDATSGGLTWTVTQYMDLGSVEIQ